MKARKTIKHAVYTLEEKEKILELYLSGEKSSLELAREYDLGNPKKIREWRDMKLRDGRLIDRRGRNIEGGKVPKSISVIAVLLVFYLRLKDRKSFFLVNGDLHAKASAIKWLGIEGDRIGWGKLALISEYPDIDHHVHRDDPDGHRVQNARSYVELYRNAAGHSAVCVS